MLKKNHLTVGLVAIGCLTSALQAQGFFLVNKTAPQVVAGEAAGFNFVTTLTLQNQSGFPYPGQVLLHRGAGQPTPTGLVVNGQNLGNPFFATIAPFSFQRFEITPAAGADVFIGAATVLDVCGQLKVTAGYELLPLTGTAASPQTGTGSAAAEIFNYEVFDISLLADHIGRAPVNTEPGNNPGLAGTGDPDLAFLSEFCQRVLGPDGEPVTSTVCNDIDGSHFNFNLKQVFPEIPALRNATWEFFFDYSPGQTQPPETPELDVLVIDVNGNQFRAAPVTKKNPHCNPTGLCLNNNRFQVTFDVFDGIGDIAAISNQDSATSGFFFGQNFEMLVKVIDGCAFNGHYWVFAAAATDVEYTLTVTDTATNQSRTYENSLGQVADAVTDTSAFATCP